VNDYCTKEYFSDSLDFLSLSLYGLKGLAGDERNGKSLKFSWSDHRPSQLAVVWSCEAFDGWTDEAETHSIVHYHSRTIPWA
jgi:hypothetical protein